MSRRSPEGLGKLLDMSKPKGSLLTRRGDVTEVGTKNWCHQPTKNRRAKVKFTLNQHTRSSFPNRFAEKEIPPRGIVAEGVVSNIK